MTTCHDNRFICTLTSAKERDIIDALAATAKTEPTYAGCVERVMAATGSDRVTVTTVARYWQSAWMAP